MCKKAVVIGLLAIGALYVCKKTPVGSYISTWWNRNCPSGEMVSRDFQLDRVETLLAKLEENRKSRLQPIAEKQEEVEHLKQQVQADQAKLNARRDRLRELIQAVEAESPSIQFEGATLTLAEAKTRLERENGAVELLRLREEELAAKEKSLQKDLADLDRIATRAQQHKTPSPSCGTRSGNCKRATPRLREACRPISPRSIATFSRRWTGPPRDSGSPGTSRTWTRGPVRKPSPVPPVGRLGATVP